MVDPLDWKQINRRVIRLRGANRLKSNVCFEGGIMDGAAGSRSTGLGGRAGTEVGVGGLAYNTLVGAFLATLFSPLNGQWTSSY